MKICLKVIIILLKERATAVFVFFMANVVISLVDTINYCFCSWKRSVLHPWCTKNKRLLYPIVCYNTQKPNNAHDLAFYHSRFDTLYIDAKFSTTITQNKKLATLFFVLFTFYFNVFIPSSFYIRNTSTRCILFKLIESKRVYDEQRKLLN